MNPAPASTSPLLMSSFGDLLKYLRRRARLTQLELAIAVGYSEGQISRLENNERLPDLTALQALFIPALNLSDEPELGARLLDLARSARQQDAPGAGLCPYKGLLFFEEVDSEWFFGREVLTARLAKHVLDLSAGGAARFLAVVGASGSGKSSLLRAGLAVVLRQAGWDVQVFTPTARPLRSLEANHGAARTNAAERTLFIVDQFEELFTLCNDEAERIGFIAELLSAAQHASRQITVVIALRADFYSHCAQYPLLRQAVAAEQEYIGQMTRDELRRAIEEPVRHGGWGLEAGLVEVLLQDLAGHSSPEPEPGALPLLSHALLATWERRRGRTLTLAGYHAIGGVRGAIAETAESVFADLLDQNQQQIAREVFLRLTALGEGTEDTRRRATLNELMRASGEAAQLRAVLNTLAQARLVTLGEDSAEVAHEALIREWQRLHGWLTEDREGLLLHRHLTESADEWAARGRDASDLYRGARLAQAREWAVSNEESLNILERSFLAASIEEEDREILEREVRRQRELEAAQQLAESEIRNSRRLRRRAILMAGAFALAIALAALAVFFGGQANFGERQARSRELAAAAVNNLGIDPERSILLALQAESVAHTVEADNALHRSIFESRVQLVLPHDEAVYSVTFSPDGKRVATASEDRAARVWDAATGELLFTLSGHTGSVNGVVFSPDGKRIATSSDDHTARVWDAETGEELLTLAGHTDWVYRIAFSPDGKRLATASNDHTARVWDAQTGEQLLTFGKHGDAVFDVAFSPDGGRIATSGYDANVRIWDPATGRELLVLPVEDGPWLRGVAFSPDGTRLGVTTAGLPGRPNGVIWDPASGQVLKEGFGDGLAQLVDIAYSPDGRMMATGGEDGKARVWDTRTGRLMYTLAGHTRIANGVAFSPDGSRLATASYDHTVRIWDISPAKELLRLPLSFTPAGSLGLPFQPSYSPDGKRLLAAVPGNGYAELWDADSGEELPNLMGPAEPINRAVYSPDGQLIAGTFGTSIIVWEARSGRQLSELPADPDAPLWVAAFSPDGTQLAAGGPTGALVIWDMETGSEALWLEQPRPPPTQLFEAPYSIMSLAYSPDGTMLVAGDSYGLGTIWDTRTGESLRTLSLEAPAQYASAVVPIMGVVYSPDGKRLALAGNQGILKIFDARTGEETLALGVPNASINSVTFAPDGDWIATSSSDGTARLWDASTGAALLTLKAGEQASGVAFSPDGKQLAVGALAPGGEAGIYVFLLSRDDLAALAESRVTRGLTAEECQEYLHADRCPPAP